MNYEYAIFNYGRPTLVQVYTEPLWPCPCAACRQRHGKPVRLSRMRAQYRRKSRGWR